jgi:hypothetical protein
MQVRNRLGVAKLGRLGAVKLYWEQHVPSHSSAARAQRAEAQRQQAALESSGDVVIVEDEEDGPEEADAEDDGVDEAAEIGSALDAAAAAREALISIWDEEQLQMLQQVKVATEQALQRVADGSMDRMRLSVRAQQVNLAADAIKGVPLTFQELLYGAWDGFNCSSAMFDPGYVPKVTPVTQLQAMGLGSANPEDFSLDALV